MKNINPNILFENNNSKYHIYRQVIESISKNRSSSKFHYDNLFSNKFIDVYKNISLLKMFNNTNISFNMINYKINYLFIKYLYLKFQSIYDIEKLYKKLLPDNKQNYYNTNIKENNYNFNYINFCGCEINIKLEKSNISNTINFNKNTNKNYNLQVFMLGKYINCNFYCDNIFNEINYYGLEYTHNNVLNYNNEIEKIPHVNYSSNNYNLYNCTYNYFENTFKRILHDIEVIKQFNMNHNMLYELKIENVYSDSFTYSYKTYNPSNDNKYSNQFIRLMKYV